MDIHPLQQQIGIGAALAFALGILLLALRPPSRTTIRNLLIMTAALVFLQIIAWALERWGATRGANLLIFVAGLGMGFVIIRLVSILSFHFVLPRLRIMLPHIVEDLSVTALAIAWLLYWLHGAGLDLGSLLATSAVITAVLAFSMQDTLGNILGGVVLQLDDSLRIGDWVTVDNVSGQVVDVRWRHTAIETRNRETVVIPNGWLVKNRFTVVGSRTDTRTRWRRWVWFNVDMHAQPSQVLQVLEDSVRDCEAPNVLLDPPPSAVLMEVGQGYARYALRYWMGDPRPDDPTDSAVRLNAIAALTRNEMHLAVVQEERLVIKENERRRAILHTDELTRRKTILGGVDLFARLSDEELNVLAEEVVPAPFVRGSTITRQGRIAHWLYVIVSGEAEVWTEQDQRRTHVAMLKPGSVVGEMGLMTGEPRRASVSAHTDVESLRLGKRGLERILRARPDIADEISAVMAARQYQLDQVRQAARRDVSAPQRSAALGARIRGFFGLDG